MFRVHSLNHTEQNIILNYFVRKITSILENTPYLCAFSEIILSSFADKMYSVYMCLNDRNRHPTLEIYELVGFLNWTSYLAEQSKEPTDTSPLSIFYSLTKLF